MKGLLVLLFMFALVAAARAAPCEAPDNSTRVSARSECLIIKTVKKEGGASAQSVLYVLLHGNHSDGSPATSMFKVADTLIEQAPPGATAVALVRPGYNDDDGNYSTGNRNRADNWTAPVIDDIADAIKTLKEFHQAKRVVLLGHSGGSAVAGVILGRHPGLADAALLVGCVCDVRQWRAGRTGGLWSSESPGDYTKRIPAKTRIAVLVGSNDAVTPPPLSEGYVADLADRGFLVDFKIIEGRDHYNIIRADKMFPMALKLGLD